MTQEIHILFLKDLAWTLIRKVLRIDDQKVCITCEHFIMTSFNDKDDVRIKEFACHKLILKDIDRVGQAEVLYCKWGATKKNYYLLRPWVIKVKANLGHRKCKYREMGGF